jgi:hypothetical protein
VATPSVRSAAPGPAYADADTTRSGLSAKQREWSRKSATVPDPLWASRSGLAALEEAVPREFLLQH